MNTGMRLDYYWSRIGKRSPITRIEQHRTLSNGHSPLPPYPCPWKVDGCTHESKTVEEHKKHIREEHNG